MKNSNFVKLLGAEIGYQLSFDKHQNYAQSQSYKQMR